MKCNIAYIANSLLTRGGGVMHKTLYFFGSSARILASFHLTPWCILYVLIPSLLVYQDRPLLSFYTHSLTTRII
jgi:hypothetical protein